MAEPFDTIQRKVLELYYCPRCGKRSDFVTVALLRSYFEEDEIPAAVVIVVACPEHQLDAISALLETFKTRTGIVHRENLYEDPLV